MIGGMRKVWNSNRSYLRKMFTIVSASLLLGSYLFSHLAFFETYSVSVTLLGSGHPKITKPESPQGSHNFVRST